MKYRSSQAGFTIIELIIIIVVLGILVGLSYVYYGDWRTRAAIGEVKNDLQSAESALESFRNFNTGYPSSLDDVNHKSSPNVSLSYSRRSDGSYCLVGNSSKIGTITWNIDTRNSKTPVEGTCS